MKQVSFIGLCVWLSFTAFSQNLVPNPGFEELIRCPHSFSTDRKDFVVPGWNSPTRGTPDLFHACSWGEADVPYNWAGSSNAHSGKGYAGIYVWSQRDDDTHYREYVQCELAEPLQAGSRYRIEFYYKLSSHSVFAVNRIGFLLSNTKINHNHDQVIREPASHTFGNDSVHFAAGGDWEHVLAEIAARGGERYLVLGNFLDNTSTRSRRLPHRIGKNSMLTHSAYFYIDDVSVTPVEPEPTAKEVTVTEFNEQTIELNRVYILKNIQFEFDSHVLMRSSFVELDKVVSYLFEHGDILVHLSGHTDFIGSDEYNLKLSRDRARSVADYLASKGIDATRIATYGFGKSRPLRPEKTDEARSINRRVEIRFINE